jgi:hypothetical protein
MPAPRAFCTILCLIALLGSCTAEKWQPEKAETTKTLLGGCILVSPAGEVPSDLYQESEIAPTDAYAPFTKKLSVYGITLIGRDDITDGFMRNVAQTINEIFPQDRVIDRELQKEILRNMYKYRTVIPLFKGKDHKFAPSDQAAWDRTTGQNSICDIIMERVPGQVNEVVEHILHHVTDVGLHYTFPAEWGISKESKLYQAMQEAIDKKYYDVRQYDDEGDEEVRNRVLLQEYAYWIIYTAWDLRETYGPREAEWSIMNSSELKAKLPRSYELFETTIPKVMAPPSRPMLRKFFEDGSDARGAE